MLNLTHSLTLTDNCANQRSDGWGVLTWLAVYIYRLLTCCYLLSGPGSAWANMWSPNHLSHTYSCANMLIITNTLLTLLLSKISIFVILGVNPLVSTVSGHPQKEGGKGEREGVGGRRKERGKGGKEGGHSLIFTWIDATVCDILCSVFVL